ncbi:MAG TPA: threonine/serine exporter family protein [Phototrophicaceae bacterium]|nr:threonine/serine exporter family protein [Phototrophicaceae bacterium]
MTGFDLVKLVVSDALWSGVAALGFAVLFNVPKRLLLGCFLSGAVGHTLRTLCVNSGASVEVGTLIGAGGVGFFGVYLSNRFDVPAFIFTVTGAIPMVPGVFAYQTVIGLLQATSATGSQTVDFLSTAGLNGVRTALILCSLAFGIAAPTLLLRRSNPVA